jgi:hypothetical protein
MLRLHRFKHGYLLELYGGREMAGAGEVLTIVMLGGVLGAVGQGGRVVIGLKKRSDEEKSSPGSTDEFDATRLVVSLIIGFIAGVGAVFSIGLDAFTSIDIKLLVALAAAGYTGTDIIEGFLGRITSGSNNNTLVPAARTQNLAASLKLTPTPKLVSAAEFRKGLRPRHIA